MALVMLRRAVTSVGKCQTKHYSPVPKRYGPSHDPARHLYIHSAPSLIQEIVHFCLSITNMLGKREIYSALKLIVAQQQKSESLTNRWRKPRLALGERGSALSHCSPFQELFEKCCFLFYIPLH